MKNICITCYYNDNGLILDDNIYNILSDMIANGDINDN